MESWIRRENLRPFFEFAAWSVGYTFDGLDWDAVALGIRDTDYDDHQRFEYPLSGRQSVATHAAVDDQSRGVGP